MDIEHKKTGGRTKGSLNRRTAEVHALVDRIISVISGGLEKDIKALSPNQRMILFAEMLEYKAPKLNRTVHEGDVQVEHKLKIEIVRGNRTDSDEPAPPRAINGSSGIIPI